MKSSQAAVGCFKANVNGAVEIETTDGERLIAKVLWVFHHRQDVEHETFHELPSSNKPDRYRNRETSGEYALDFSHICPVDPANCIAAPAVYSSPEPQS